MNTMTTYSGRKFDPMQMTPGDVYIEDIAHALSLLCRGGGQLTYFYSVGQHSLNCAAEAKARGWSKRQQEDMEAGSHLPVCSMMPARDIYRISSAR